MFQTSEALDKLAPAFAKVQAVVEGAKKKSSNPHFKSKYADLASSWEACRDALTENGFTVSQWPGPTENGTMALTTMLLHSSGQWIRETLTIPVGKLDPQGYGSATTYARRYALQAAVGLSPEDDDGNAAVKAGPASTFITDEQTADIQALAEEVGADIAAFCKYIGVHTISQIPANQYQRAIGALEAKRKKEAA